MTGPFQSAAISTRRHWRTVAKATGIGLALVIGQGLITSVAEIAVLGPDSETWAAAIGETVMGVVVLGLLWRLGWLRLAAVTGRWRPRLIPSSGWIIITCLLPAVALAQTSWEPAAKIIALGVDYLATGFYEELAFRGLIFVFLARAWQDHHSGIVAAALVSGVIFGLVHFNPILLVVGPLFALAFTRLQIDTRTIWISVGLHAAFDWLTEFPFDADGTSTDYWTEPVSLGALVVAGVLGFRSLSARHHNLDAAMTTAP